MKVFKLAFMLGTGSMLCAFGAAQGATSITVDTGVSPSWTVSAGAARDVQPDLVNGPNHDLSVSSNGFSTGTPVSGLDLGSFDGYWTANFPFYVPADATGVTLSFSKLTADDRVVLELNGVQIGNAGYTAGLGAMTLTDQGANILYQFDGNYTTGTITDGFILGAPNLLQAIINNTGHGINDVPQDIGVSDGTDFGIHGTITYAVPEPGSLSLMAGGLVVLLTRRRRVVIRKPGVR